MGDVPDTSPDAGATTAPSVPLEASKAALLECRLCNLRFSTHREKRQHAKSDWHVYKIRCRVAEPGTSIPPPAQSEPRRRPASKGHGSGRGTPEPSNPASSPIVKEGEDEDEDENEDENESENEDGSLSSSASDADSDADPSGSDAAEFVPEVCLFCSHASGSLDENLAHMRRAHGFLVPLRPALAVDLPTLLWFLHMVIFSYRECVCCGTRRRTPAAVQQHMASTGHCRFDVSDETRALYDPRRLAELARQQAVARPDEAALRLPSGRVLLSRRPEGAGEGAARTRERRRLAGPSASSGNGGSWSLGTAAAAADDDDSHPGDGDGGGGGGGMGAEEEESSSSPLSEAPGGSRALTKQDRRAQALVAQLATLRLSDQTALVRLSAPEQRAVLAARKREADKARRAERRQRRRLDDVGNKTAVHTKYYKQEVPVYMGG
ncbi:hypothetical protein VTJ83DRAFT_7073 [Remersonia thermophila]|uniref:C2H2-type domain-containing protein n=1 Tax=Remersonia thermophila TaxID=72144 RepID=A0ABR4D2F3_9PEZI